MGNKTVLKDGLSIISQCKKKQMIFGMHISEQLQLLVIFMKDNNMEEEITQSMFSQTKMMLSKQNLGEIIDKKKKLIFTVLKK